MPDTVYNNVFVSMLSRPEFNADREESRQQGIEE
jgi:hypothetical protein